MKDSMTEKDLATLQRLAAGAFKATLEEEQKELHCFFLARHIVETQGTSWERAVKGVHMMVQAGVILPANDESTIFKINNLKN